MIRAPLAPRCPGASLVLFFVLGCGGSATPAASPASPAAAPSPASASAPEKNDTWPFGPAQSSDDRASQLDRLAREPGPLKSNWVPPGKSARYGHAEGLVAAPLDVVRAKLVDFGHYKELAGPKFETVKIVDKNGPAIDLYFSLPIMKGIVKLWYVTRFTGAREVAGGQVIEGSFVKGNIKDMQIAFTLRPGPDDASSVVVCDLNLSLAIPAPESAVDEELRDACGDAINSVRRTTTAPR